MRGSHASKIDHSQRDLPGPSHPVRALLQLLIALLPALYAGCSKSSAETPGLLRLDLLPTQAEPRGRDVTVTGTVDWPEDPARIHADGAEVRVERDAAGKTWLNVSERAGAGGFAQLVSIKLEARFDPTTFNKLVLSSETPEEAYAHCAFLERGVLMLGSRNRPRLDPREPGAGASRAVLELPAASQYFEPFDELELVFDNVKQPFRLGSLELCQQPVWAWLPAAEEGFDMVRVGSDARNGVGLSTARTLEGDAVVLAGAELSFAAAIPTSLRVSTSTPVLNVEIRDESDAPWIEHVRLESDPQVAPEWHSVRIPLTRFAGRHIRVLLSFHIEKRFGEAVCAVTRPRIKVARASPRTVLLVTSDTHRADSIGADSPSTGVQTPAIDALASRGVLFEDCWSSTNVTLPSHAAIMTATSPRDTGVLDNHSRLSREAFTLAEAFQDAGFATYAVVSAPHLADASSGLGQGFDRMSAPRDQDKRPAAESIEQLLEWLPDAEGQDLFVWLHVFDAHAPYAPPAEFEGRYWKPGRDAADPALPEPQVPEMYRINLPAGVRDLGLLTARYRGEVSYLDSRLAQLFEHPRLRSGVIALTADHGESLGEHGIFWDHAGLYPQTIHVPLILAWPQAPAGSRVKEPVFQLDLAQTLLHLAHVDEPRIPGADLLGARPSSHQARFTIACDADRASITQDHWHLIVSLTACAVTVGAQVQDMPPHHFELFDLANDPACERDLARDEPERVRDLRLRLCAWLAAAAPHGWCDRGDPDPEMKAHLAQLGYAAASGAPPIAPLPADCRCPECAPYLPAH